MGASDYISKTSYIPQAYEDIDQTWPVSKEQYEERVASALNAFAESNADVNSITYESDGLKVTGVEILPSDLEPDEKIPLLVCNRGGCREYGAITPPVIQTWLLPHIQHMRVGIVASQYRGNSGGEGIEEYGGADVNDVLNLMEIGRNQPWWNGDTFMSGWSRGSMMTCLALKHGAEVNAVTLGAGIYDLHDTIERRPDFITVVAEPLIPNWSTKREQTLNDRSAISWPEKINAPVLMLHGDADQQADIGQARKFAEALAEKGKDVKYLEYPGDDHGLTKNSASADKAIADWFKQHATVKGKWTSSVGNRGDIEIC